MRHSLSACEPFLRSMELHCSIIDSELTMSPWHRQACGISWKALSGVLLQADLDNGPEQLCLGFRGTLSAQIQ